MNFLIDPHTVTNFNRTNDELELWLLFGAVVAGKTATTQARLLEAFLLGLEGDGPFNRCRRALEAGTLLEGLKMSRLGQYNRLYNFISDAVLLDLATCTLVDLEAIRGCGPKTARMFLMHSRPNQRLAAVDTHVLKSLAAAGHSVSKATPPAGKLYLRLEALFLEMADASGMSVADYDLAVWSRYARPISGNASRLSSIRS